MKVMEGLKYTLREIEAKRSLLRQGKDDSEVSRYIEQYGKPPTEILDPSKLPPNGYEIKEVLEYWPGRTSIRFLLGTPNLINSERLLCLYVEQRQAQISIIKYVKNEVEWTYPGGFEIDDKELEKLLVVAHPYARWKKDAWKVRPRLNPANNRGDVGGAAIAHEGNKIFTVPIIVIEEDTTRKQIWGQLLLSAWGHGYFDKNGEVLAYEHLKQYYKEDVLIDLLLHFSKHTFSPYSAITNMNYIKRVFSGYSKKQKHKESSGARYEMRDGDGLSFVYSAYPGSVSDAVQRTGVSEWIIWRLIRQGKLKAGKNDDGFIFLDDIAIDQLRQLANQKDKRINIYNLAGLKEKSRQATKKWLQRHRDLIENEFQEQFIKWLKNTKSKRSKPQ